jgi:hypothetical protein
MATFDPRSARPTGHPSSRTATWVGFGVSGVLHVLALLLYASFDVRFGVLRPGESTAPESEMRGIEVINLQEVRGPEAETPLEPERMAIPVPTAPRAAADADPAAEAIAPVVPDLPSPRRATAAQRLQPGTNDARLWQPLAEEVVALTMEQRLENYLAGELLDLMDALAYEAARAEAATDWTYTDDEGRRWGISPGKLHLGSITLPLPFSFGTPAGASENLMRRYLQDAEIRRAAGQLLTDQTLRERAQAIRARRDAERQRSRTRSDSSVVRRRGGGSNAPN